MKVHAILKRFLLCVEFKWTQFIRATPSWVAIELLNRSYSSGHFLNANNHHNVFAKQSPTFVGACCKVTYHTVNQKYGESSASFAGWMDCWTCFLFKWGLWSFSWTIKSPYAENLSLTECSPQIRDMCFISAVFVFVTPRSLRIWAKPQWILVATQRSLRKCFDNPESGHFHWNLLPTNLFTGLHSNKNRDHQLQTLGNEITNNFWLTGQPGQPFFMYPCILIRKKHCFMFAPKI